MRYVIIGAGIAGTEAAKVIRSEDSSAEIILISADTNVHSRCMLHKYISGERDEKSLDFTEDNFFEKYKIQWMPGIKVTEVCPDKKEIALSSKERLSYDKLLIANGSDSVIPPVGELRGASNVFGLRNLSDAQAIVKEAKNADNILIIGSGLVGLDAAYGLLELKKQITIVEMAPQILPVQLGPHGAKAFQEKFEDAGCRFILGRRAEQASCEEDGRIHKVILDDGQQVPCDMIIVAAGVRASCSYLEGSGIVCDRGVKVDSHMRTSAEDVYAAGDITGLSGIWPNAAAQGIAAGKNMAGTETEYTDTYAIKNTINFFGLVSLCVGRIKEEEGDEILEKEDQKQYKRIILRDGKVQGIQLLGDISNAGFWQYLIKNQVDISCIKKDVFHISYADFYGMDEKGKYVWQCAGR